MFFSLIYVWGVEENITLPSTKYGSEYWTTVKRNEGKKQRKGLRIGRVKKYKYYVFGHYPSSCLYLKNRPVYFLKHNASETGFCPRLQVKPAQLGPIDRASPVSETLCFRK
jgi:hypothetical protein